MAARDPALIDKCLKPTVEGLALLLTSLQCSPASQWDDWIAWVPREANTMADWATTESIMDQETMEPRLWISESAVMRMMCSRALGKQILLAVSSDGGVRGRLAGAGVVIERVLLYPDAPRPVPHFLGEVRPALGEEQAWKLASRLPATQVGITTEPIVIAMIPQPEGATVMQTEASALWTAVNLLRALTSETLMKAQRESQIARPYLEAAVVSNIEKATANLLIRWPRHLWQACAKAYGSVASHQLSRCLAVVVVLLWYPCFATGILLL